MSSPWTHRMCGECYIPHAYKEATEGGHPGFLRVPVQVNGTPPGTCCFCGRPTVLGIYLRSDPSKLPCAELHKEGPV